MNRDEIAYKKLLQGIQNYTQECLARCGYDKTYTAIITNIVPNGYTILLNGNIYNNVPTIGGTCVINETVKVVVPQNNYSNMFILKGKQTTGGGGEGGSVTSVNGKQGDVVLYSEDVGALPSSSQEVIDIDFSNYFN